MADPIIKIESIEVTTLKQVIIFFNGNQAQAAKHINMSRTTFCKWLNSKYVYLVEVTRDKNGDISGFKRINH